MLTLTISEETLKNAFEVHLNKIMEAGQYDNPVKRALDTLLGYNGDKEIKEIIDAKVKDYVKFYLDSTDFKLALGTAMAHIIAKNQLEKAKL